MRVIAAQHGMHATFMPKPIFGENGSGMHTNQSLSTASGDNAFYDPNDELQLSEVAYGYIAGVLEHVRGITAVANPTVNSYKRLVPGYEAPVYIAWSPGNRSAAIRVPNKRGRSTRAELRTPDPDGEPVPGVRGDAGGGPRRHQARPQAARAGEQEHLPPDRGGVGGARHRAPAAQPEPTRSTPWSPTTVLRSALWATTSPTRSSPEKRAEWSEYQAQVHQWEIDKYMETF